MKRPEPQELRVTDSELGTRTTGLHAAKRVLGNSGSHNKIPKSRWLKQWKFISHGSGSWKFEMRV